MTIRYISVTVLQSVTFLLCTGFLFGQKTDTIPATDSLTTLSLSEVVITANRYESIPIKTSEAIRVIDGKTVNKYQLRTTSEALTLTPGVFVQKTNHGGGSPFLRGLTGNQTLMLIDGVRLSNATMRYGPNQYFNTIDVFNIEKIEVLRGSGSVQYGSDALGGTLQIFTHNLEMLDKPAWGTSLVTRISTQGMEQSLNGSIKYGNKRLALRAGITLRNFGDLVGGDTTGHQIPTGYQERDFDLKGKFRLSSSTDITIAYQSVHQSDVPVYHKVVLENYAINKMDPQKRELSYVKLNQKVNSGILKALTFITSFQHSEEGRELLKNGSASLRLENDKVNSLSFSAEAFTSGSGWWSANTGLELYNDKVKSTRFDKDLLTGDVVSKRGLYPDGASMTSVAFFSVHKFDLQKWTITSGARLNTFINKVFDETLGKVELTPSALVGNFAVLRKVNVKSNLFVSANTGFRAPNIDDLGTLGIVDFRYETPNYDLKPEHSFQYQVGYKYLSPVLRGEIYLYRNELYNLIVRNRIAGDTIEGYPVYMKDNVERAYIQGFETAWDIELSNYWMISANMTYTYGQNITRNEPVRRIPPLFGRLAIEYELRYWWINLECIAAGKQDRLAAGDKDDNRIPAGGTPGWNIFNLNTGYAWRSVKVDLSLLNLLNKDYRFHGSGVNGYGRSAFLSVSLSI